MLTDRVIRFAEKHDPAVAKMVAEGSTGPVDEFLFAEIWQISSDACRWSDVDAISKLAIIDGIGAALTVESLRRDLPMDPENEVPEHVDRTIGAEVSIAAAQAFRRGQPIGMHGRLTGRLRSLEHYAETLRSQIVETFDVGMRAAPAEFSTRYHAGVMMCAFYSIEAVAASELSLAPGN